MPLMAATRRADASTRPTSSAFCSPVDDRARVGGFRAVPHDEVGEVRADRRAPRRGVPGAGIAQEPAIAILRLERRARSHQGFDRAVERHIGPGKGRSLIAMLADEGREARHRLVSGRRDSDPERRHLAFCGVCPGRIDTTRGPPVLEHAIAGCATPVRAP